MAYYVHNPALLTHADGFALTNGATTDAAAGWVLTCALSAGGTVTHRTSPVRSWESVGNAGVARLDGPVTSAAILGVELLLDITAWPTGAANRLVELRHSTNYALKVEQNTSGQIFILNAANATIWTSTAVATGLVRIFVAIDPGTGTTDGKVRLNLYTTNPTTSTTPDQTYSSDVQNAGTANLVVARFPRVSSTAASTATVRTINAQAQDSLTPIGPLSSGVTGTAAQTLPAIGQAAAGTATPPAFTGAVTQTLPAMTQASAGTMTPPAFTADAAQTLPALGQGAAGSATAPAFTAAIAQALPVLTQSAAGSSAAPGAVGVTAQTLPTITQAAAGTTEVPTWVAVITQALPAMTQAALDTSGYRDLTITVTGPTGHPLTLAGPHSRSLAFTGPTGRVLVVSPPTAYPVTITGPTGHPLTVRSAP